MKRFTVCMAAILVACSALFMQGGTALAALYQGDIGETRFSTVEGTYILKRYVPPQGGASGAYGASSSSGSWSGGGLTVVPPTPQQGEYEIVDEAQSPLTSTIPEPLRYTKTRVRYSGFSTVRAAPASM